MAKLPAMQFYPGDWMKDPSLRSVSLEARGLWIDMLCLMHESPRRGYMQHGNGKKIGDDQLARIAGILPEKVAVLLAELEMSGVFSKDITGIIFSRRVVRDEKIRKKRRLAGKMGGNPNFSVGKANPYYDKQIDKQMDKQKISPSSSVSSSSSDVITPSLSSPPFQAPTLEEVKAYAEHLGFKLNAERFLAFYEANGWVQGKARKPITSWKACVRTWMANDGQAKDNLERLAQVGHAIKGVS